MKRKFEIKNMGIQLANLQFAFYHLLCIFPYIKSPRKGYFHED